MNSYWAKQYSILIMAGYGVCADGSWRLVSEVLQYDNERKPMLTAKQMAEKRLKINRNMITNDFISYFIDASSFLRSMKNKTTNKK
jgi:hypothetical protein